MKVKAGGKREFVQKIDDDNFIVSVTSAPEKGRANEKIIQVLSDHFHVPKSAIKILSGHVSKTKLIQVHI